MLVDFDDATHTGTINGRPVISVTQAIKECGLYIGAEFFRPDGAVLGKYIHQTTELHDKKILDEDELDPILAGYLASWKAFRDHTGFEPILIEERIFSERLQLTGCLDRFGKMGDGRLFLPDIKHGGVQPIADPLQTAAYKILLADSQWIKDYLNQPIHRCAVYLNADGSMPNVKPHDKNQDIANFMAVLTVAQLRRSHGIQN